MVARHQPRRIQDQRHRFIRQDGRIVYHIRDNGHKVLMFHSPLFASIAGFQVAVEFALTENALNEIGQDSVVSKTDLAQ